MSEQAKSEAQEFMESFVEAKESTASPSGPADAVSSYLDARGQYGTNRTLHVPDGKVEQAYYGYVKPSVGRGHSRSFSRGGSGIRHGVGRSSRTSITESWHDKATSNDTHITMHDCVPSGWWRRFWGQVSSNLSSR